MRKLSSLTLKQKEIILMVASSITNALTLAFAITTVYHQAIENDSMLRVFFVFSFLFESFCMLDLVFFNKIFTHNKIGFIKHLVFCIIYFLISIVAIFVPIAPIPIGIITLIFMLTICANRLCKIFETKKVFLMVFNGILSLLALIIAAIVLFSMEESSLVSFILLVSAILVFVSLTNIMVFAFSRIQLGTLLKIMRKTFAFEVLYGLFVLIFSFSFIFTIFEDNILTYGDALWYSFAIVTTIGFGDMVAVGALGRVLSVILGIYGIIVVALITSIIVNFYTEVKNKKDPDECKKETKELEEKNKE